MNQSNIIETNPYKYKWCIFKTFAKLECEALNVLKVLAGKNWRMSWKIYKRR